jgi:hypothetical protein
MKNGLKGVTDATVFCKSMQKNSPKPMIRSMKSYAAGGVTDAECASKPKLPACFKKFKSKGRSSEKKGGVLGTAILGALGGLGYGAYKKLKSKE